MINDYFKIGPAQRHTAVQTIPTGAGSRKKERMETHVQSAFQSTDHLQYVSRQL